MSDTVPPAGGGAAVLLRERSSSEEVSQVRILLAISAALCSTIGLAACGAAPDSPATAAAEVSDSAGIRIVSMGSAVPTDTLEPRRLWDHGSESSDYLFQRVGFGVLRDDGSAVVADAGSNEIVAIEANGRGHRVLARTGQGPAEVRGPRQVVTHGGLDVWVEDSRSGKLLRFVRDSVQDVLAGSANPSVGERLMPIGVDSAGRILMTTGSYSPRFEEPWLHAPLVVLDPGESTIDTVGSFPFTPRVGEPPVSPFEGYGVVTVAAGRFVTARTDIAELVWHAGDGAVAQISRWSPAPEYPDSDDWAEFSASIRAGTERMNPGRSEAQYDDMHARTMSGWFLDESEPVRLFDHIVGAEGGGVWLAPFTPSRSSPPAPLEWVVVSAQGEWLGVARFDRPTRILHVTDELILGVHIGELDLETVVAYENPFGTS